MHPAIIQLRGRYADIFEDVMKLIEKYCGDFRVERVRGGVNVFISDVNDARKTISKIQKLKKAEIKMSTKYAGLRRGRVRVLFVYCLRF
jgi:ribosome maturation protein Sdo1